MTKKIRKLLHRNHPMGQLNDGAKRLGDARWATATIEQAHASATLVHKYHRGMGIDRIASRSVLHLVRELLFGVATEGA